MSENILARVKVASPCTADWQAMKGDDQVRFCGHCERHVYNLSAMTRRDAEILLSSGQRICGRYYQRADGTILTEDCPVGLRAKAVRIQRRVGLAISGFLGFATAFGQTRPESGAQIQIEQSAESQLSGVVRDVNRAVIVAASVTALDEKTGKSMTAQVNDRGEFQLRLPPANYTVTIQSPGFGLFKKEKIVLVANRAMRFDVTLQVGLMGEIVEVERKPR